MTLSEYTKKARAEDAKRGEIRSYKGNRYKATGTTTSGKRFVIHSDNGHHIMGINLYSGSKWVKYPDENKWRLFYRV